ncbi:hypothetical protein AA0313_1937 [Acetobacter indonesiensis NRIC 0313]|nr:hypothetical protein AA0313_1937 [Acetobacter indonesiensis NRIC 0313]
MVAACSVAGWGNTDGHSHALEQEREDILKRRQDWFDLQPDLDPPRLVLIAGNAAALVCRMASVRYQANSLK